MHHLKETVIDGVKFVLIPRQLHDDLARQVFLAWSQELSELAQEWLKFNPEIRDVI